jgi:hypothetical protein
MGSASEARTERNGTVFPRRSACPHVTLFFFFFWQTQKRRWNGRAGQGERDIEVGEEDGFDRMEGARELVCRTQWGWWAT